MMEAGLYVVATPIGRLKDITLTALEILAAVDLILCEDTRVTSRILKHYQIDTKCMPLHKFNEANSVSALLKKIELGQKLALVSDAGTPAIHDPGNRLVAAVQANKLYLAVVPGPSAVTAALSVAGCPADQFTFKGFLPNKKQGLEAMLTLINQSPETVVCFESTHRIKHTIAAIQKKMAPDRVIVLCKELTKIYETIIAVSVAELPEVLVRSDCFFKGEWVLVFKPHKVMVSGPTAQAKQLLQHLIPACGVSQAVKITKDITGESKKELYDYAIKESG